MDRLTRARRLVPDQRERRRATCTSAAIMIFEGPPPSYDDLLDHVALAPAPRAALSPEARLPAGATGRPFWVDDPAFNLELPRPPLGASRRPGSEEQLRNMAARVFSPAARPHEAALGAVDGPGADPQALRARHQDPPRARRRRLRGRHRDRPVRRQAGARARRARARLDPEPEPVAPPSCSPRTPRGSPGAPVRRAAPARAARSSTRGRRCDQVAEAAEALGEVGWNFANPAPKVPLNVADRLAPALRLGARRPRPVQADQERARRDRQRRRPRRRRRRDARLAARARRPHRGPRAARAGPGLDPRRATSAASSATGSPRCAGRCPVYVEDPVQRLEVVPQGRWRGSSTRSRRSAPR